MKQVTDFRYVRFHAIFHDEVGVYDEDEQGRPRWNVDGTDLGTARLDAYRSQMLVMRDFMLAFERPNELFIESEPSRPIPCWCEGGKDIAAPASGIQ